MSVRKVVSVLLLLLLPSARLLADRTEQIRASLPSLKGEALLAAYDTLFAFSYLHGDINEQIRCANDAIEESKRQHQAEKAARYMCDRVALLYNADMNDSLFHVVKDDLPFLRKHKQWKYYYEEWTHLVNAYAYSGLTSIGLIEMQAMYEDAVNRHDTYGTGLSYYAMGNVYANIHNWEESARCYLKSIDHLSTINPPPMLLPDVYSNYGDVLDEQGDYEQLRKHTLQWRKFLDATYQADSTNFEETKLLWGYYYIACSQAALGLNQLEEADSLLQQVKRCVSFEDDYINMSWMYYRAQLFFQRQQYGSALELNNQRMQLMQETDDVSMKVKVRLQRAEILSHLGRHAEAAQLYREIYNINDSVNTQETKQQLTETNTKYQTTLLEREQARTLLRTFVLGASIIVFVLIAFIIYRHRASKRLKVAHDKLLVAYDQLEETTTAKERIESELRIARDIQMGMVPTQFPPFPERTDIDLFASMTPAKEVGGDLYDYFILNEHLYFCLGDVSGKGVPASLFMAVARNLFRVIAQHEIPSYEIAHQLNEALSADNENGMFVTMFIGVADLTTGRLDFCNCGHNPPVVLNDGDAAHFLEMEYNCCLGLFPGAEFEGGTIDNIYGHPLFIYTDGLNEAENAAQEQFSDKRLLAVLQSITFESAQKTIEMLKDEVARHVDGADPSDDLTMLCFKIKGDDGMAGEEKKENS